MTTKPRKPASSTRGTKTRTRTTRRRPSTGATLGTAIGTLLGGAAWALFDRVPWWLLVLIVLGGLLVGFLVHRAKTARSAEPTGSAEPTVPSGG